MELLNHHFLLLQINDSLFPIGGYFPIPTGWKPISRKESYRSGNWRRNISGKRLSYNFL